MAQNHATGGCQCGAVRYELTAPPLNVYVCHCSECRAQSSSAFGISVIVALESFHVVKGKPRFWSRPAAVSGLLDCYFCPECGARLWHQDRGATDVVSVKGGSLDHSVDLSDVDHIWTRSKLPGVIIPSHARQFREAPDQTA